MICPKYASLRAKTTENLNYNKRNACQSCMSKLKWLLSNEDACVCKDIASFITICFFFNKGLDDLYLSDVSHILAFHPRVIVPHSKTGIV